MVKVRCFFGRALVVLDIELTSLEGWFHGPGV
jgi:hypothetical protein